MFTSGLMRQVLISASRSIGASALNRTLATRSMATAITKNGIYQNQQVGNRLRGKKAIVTGGSNGIGEAIALGYAREGADVMITYASNNDAAEKVVSTMKRHGGKAKAIKFDLRKPEDLENVVTHGINFLGKIDILVNNASVLAGRDKHFLNMTDNELQDCLNVYLMGPMKLAQKVCKQMIVQGGGGSIINLSSVADRKPFDNKSIGYDVAKAGITTFTKSLAFHMAQHGITVNAIAPGLVITPRIKDKVLSKKGQEAVSTMIPLGKAGESQDFSEMAIAIAQNKFMTGSVVVIDGGMSLGNRAAQDEEFLSANQNQPSPKL